MDEPSIRAGRIDRDQLRVLLKCYFRLSTRGRVTQTMGGQRRGLPLLVGLSA